MNKQRLLGFLPIGISITVVAILAYVLRVILTPFLVAYILQFALMPFVLMLTRRGMKHSSAVLVVFISTFAILALAVTFIVPAIAAELTTVQDNLEDYATILAGKYEEIQLLLNGDHGVIGRFMSEQSLAEELTSSVKGSLTALIQGLTKNVFSFLGLFLNLSVIPFATFFFLYENLRIKKNLIAMVPNRYFEITLNMIHRLNLQVGLILRGMLTSVAAISFISTVGLWAIGLDYPILVGVFAGIANLIPYFGPIAGAVAACLVALITGKSLMFFVTIAGVFLAVNIIDNVLVQPIVFSKAANLHPLIIIFLVLAGSKAGGMTGMLLAVPLASLAQVVYSIVATELKRPLRPPFADFTARNS